MGPEGMSVDPPITNTTSQPRYGYLSRNSNNFVFILVIWINIRETKTAMLSASLVTMAWHILRLRMEMTASRYERR
jgi:hypothetical protein